MLSFEVHDMKYNDRFFTWNNKQHGDKRVFRKIDRAMCNSVWDEVYSNVEVIFLQGGNLISHLFWFSSLPIYQERDRLNFLISGLIMILFLILLRLFGRLMLRGL